MEPSPSRFLPLIDMVAARPEKERRLIEEACRFAEDAHQGQLRESGVPYFTHVFETARNLARIGADTDTIVAGLLHDVVEDATKTPKEIEEHFGEDVAFLVEGVTKLGKLKYRGLKRHVETLRKLFMATAEDPRVVLIKLADRLHNLATIDALSPEKQNRIATETLEMYAPIAHRLGIGQFKGELEDLAFKIIDPDGYAETETLRKERSENAVRELRGISEQLSRLLAEAHVPVKTMDYRVKHLYSLHKKLRQKDMNIDTVYDITALRVIVETVEDCYLALGIIHAKWKPLPGRIKDYIAIPKPNGYQSLHTTVFTGDGSIVEIQVRTEEMHEVAERGIASHILYKERNPGNSESIQVAHALLRKRAQDSSLGEQRWIKDLAETQRDVSRTNTFLRNLKRDFFSDRIFVFTPRGEVIDLPRDATPIDFAYAIHTDLGHHASGARVNGKFVALSTKLKEGDIVEIESREANKPSAKWLQWVQTGFAKKKIRAALGLTEDVKR